MGNIVVPLRSPLPTSVSPLQLELEQDKNGPEVDSEVEVVEEEELQVVPQCLAPVEPKKKIRAEDGPIVIEEDSDEDEEASKKKYIHGCPHYKRRCRLVCPDPKCDKVYTCRVCHDEQEEHPLDRYNLKEVVCILCDERQPVGHSCIKCSSLFGKFYCKICHLFMDVYKDTFHCEGCGLCRVGPRENYFHCDACSMCMPTSLGEGKHKCIEQTSRRNCPLCLQDIHTSRSSSHIPPCGHLLHLSCFNQLIGKALYACPTCNQSMVEMGVIWQYLDEQIAKSPPLPAEFTNNVHILCRDCHQITEVKFHFIGLKCGKCGSYNTCIERGSPLNANYE